MIVREALKKQSKTAFIGLKNGSIRLLNTLNDRRMPCLMFPGQGSQKLAMLKEYAEKYPSIVNPILQEVDHSLSFSFEKFSNILVDENCGENINRTSLAQPAIVATSYAISKVFEHFFGKPIAKKFRMSMGHSLGEFSALIASGVLEFNHAIWLVHQRGMVMEAAQSSYLEVHNVEPENAGMYAVLVSTKEPVSHVVEVMDMVLEERPELDAVSVANVNSSGQVVLSGTQVQVDRLLEALKARIKVSSRVVKLNVNASFHSPLMNIAETEMEAICEDTALYAHWPPTIDHVISNASARPFKTLDEVLYCLVTSCTHRVRWYQSVKYVQSRGTKLFVPVGPGNIGDLTKRDFDRGTVVLPLVRENWETIARLLEEER